MRYRYSLIQSLVFFLIIGALSATLLEGSSHAQGDAGKGERRTLASPRYVGRQVCTGCHKKQHDRWSGSHHDLAMQVVNEESVLGDFDNRRFTQFGVTSTFYKGDGKFFVRTDGPDGELHDYEIKYTFGFTPLQQYLIEFPDGRLQALDIAWDSRPKQEGGQRWIHLHPDEKITHEHLLHWTGPYLNWNYMCAECHSTNLKKNFDLKTNTYRTTWSEINVSCEACHGPGSSHVAWARTRQETDYSEEENRKKGLVIDLDAADSRVQVDACARCHSRRIIVSDDYNHSKKFMDFYIPRLLLEHLYYPDGQILDEVYVYGSFIQSEKHHQGVRCTDCHDPHTARLVSPGNRLCMRCHQASPPQEFDGLKPRDYDTKGHHFHEPGRSGSFCVDCHMPATNYMVVDPRRDHSFIMPRPDLTEKLGTPNPCTGCHQDKPAQWAAERVARWYSQRGEPHFAEIIAAGRAGKPEARPELIRVARDASQPAIVRATALNLLPRYPDPEALAVMVSSLKDIDPLVRVTAVRGISFVVPSAMGVDWLRLKLDWIAPLLKDPVRAVRTEAARALTDVPDHLFGPSQRRAFEAALDEFKKRQYAIADRPDAHLNLGVIYQNMGQIDLAEQSYRTAIRMDHRFVPARFNLANLYNALGHHKRAEEELREIIKLTPENGEAHYSLALLLAEVSRLEEAADSLANAASLLPDRARVRYNFALALQHLGRRSEAEAEMIKAHHTDPRDTDILYASVIFYVQERHWEEALGYAQKLIELAPATPGLDRLIEEIQTGLSGRRSP
jgi:predicted CXXCH cytochrome family protein